MIPIIDIYPQRGFLHYQLSIHKSPLPTAKAAANMAAALGFLQFLASFRQASASSFRVEQGIMGHTWLTAMVLFKYFQFRSGMGFSHSTRPESRFASCRARTARWVSTVLLSERMINVVEPFRIGGRKAHSLSRAVPRSVPRP